MLFYDFSILNEIYSLKIIQKGIAFLFGSLWPKVNQFWKFISSVTFLNLNSNIKIFNKEALENIRVGVNEFVDIVCRRTHHIWKCPSLRGQPHSRIWLKRNPAAGSAYFTSRIRSPRFLHGCPRTDDWPCRLTMTPSRAALSCFTRHSRACERPRACVSCVIPESVADHTKTIHRYCSSRKRESVVLAWILYS